MSLPSFKIVVDEGQEQLNTGNFLIIFHWVLTSTCEEDMIIPVLLVNPRFRKVKTLAQNIQEVHAPYFRAQVYRFQIIFLTKMC